MDKGKAKIGRNRYTKIKRRRRGGMKKQKVRERERR